MHPVLFQFGGIAIYTYGVLVATGVVIGLCYARRQAARVGLDPRRVWDMGIYAIIAALVLAKVWLVFSDWSFYMAHPREILGLATIQSGGDFYGGVIGAVVVLLIYSYVYRMPLISVLDTFAAALPIGHAIGRLGCFSAGCCYGKPTTLPWGVTFSNPLAAQIAGTPLGVRLQPTQLYEAVAEFVNFLILVWIGKRQRFKGQILGTYFLLYGAERGTIEFFRGDPGRTMMFHNSISLMQVVSVGLILAGGFLWYRGLRGAAPIRQAMVPASR
jgi:phosphatidylglycerol---prolipoprotein diacylglyceryl transferase